MHRIIAMLIPLLAALALGAPAPKTLILAHYMPWFQAKPVSREWGWHWTMGKLNPDIMTKGRRQAAAHDYPLVGLYDSSDPDLLEYQTLEMKVAGIDGVLIDWYGTADLYDYLPNHQNTLRMIAAARKVGLRFGIVYEDQTVGNLIAQKKWNAADAVRNGAELMRWVDQNWFSAPDYVRIDGKPAFFVFGPQYYKEPDWPVLFQGLAHKPTFLSLHYKRSTADGAYDWPLPGGGDAGSDKHVDDFYRQAKSWSVSVPVAFPRFNDFYKEAGLHNGYGHVNDRDGTTYTRLLDRALASRPPIVQLATWNDWGEGTEIEPSVEYGYRDLEATQRLRSKYLGHSPYTAADLRLPVKIYELRKAGKTRAKLDRAVALLVAGKGKAAANLLASVK